SDRLTTGNLSERPRANPPFFSASPSHADLVLCRGSTGIWISPHDDLHRHQCAGARGGAGFPPIGEKPPRLALAELAEAAVWHALAATAGPGRSANQRHPPLGG